MKRLLRAVLEHGPASRVLDGGCGAGDSARWLAERGCHVLAVDTELDADLSGTCDVMGEGRVEWMAGDIKGVSGAQSFDVVCLFGVLHYPGSAQRVRQLLTHVSELLRVGGLLALSWITDDIPLVGRKGYLPPRSLVQNTISSCGLTAGRLWDAEIEHAHGGMDKHRHVIVYGTWTRASRDAGEFGY